MGNSESAPPDAGTSIDDFDGVETLGYRVLGVQPNSPASAAGLVSFFDFLIGADGQMLLGSGEELEDGEEYDDIDFPALLERFKGKPLQLLVWNIKCQEKRLVDIVPSDDWEGAGLLGVTIRLDNYGGAEDRLIRILSVEHNSPAAIAGLVETQDYLLGTTTHSFDSTKVLAAVLEAHVDRVVELYVFNTSTDKVRVVALMPTWSWGGNGLLGAEVGTGYLHRIPASCRGTLGGSVERKVRWVGGSKSGPTTPQSQQTEAFELEPQLEMEPDDEEEPAEGGDERSIDTVSLASQQQAAENGTPAEAVSTPSMSTPEGETRSNDTAESNGTPAVVKSHAEEVQPTSEATPERQTPEQNRDNSNGESLHPKIIRNDSGKSYQTHYQSTVPTGRPIAAPAPYPLPNLQNDSNSPNITTFIPASKPPNGSNVSAEDLFSGPPPVAKIPSKANLQWQSPVADRKVPPRSYTDISGTNTNGEPPFSTPHPPNAVRSPTSETYGRTPPVPPVATDSGVAGMPPPPAMTGAHQ